MEDQLRECPFCGIIPIYCPDPSEVFCPESRPEHICKCGIRGCVEHGAESSGLADFIIADRKRIVEPLLKEDMSKYDNAPFEAIRQTLKNAGVEQ